MTHWRCHDWLSSYGTTETDDFRCLWLERNGERNFHLDFLVTMEFENGTMVIRLRNNGSAMVETRH